MGLTDLHDNYLDKMDEVHANDVVAKYNAVTEQYNSKSIIDKFYEDLNTIEWGIYNNNPKNQRVYIFRINSWDLQ